MAAAEPRSKMAEADVGCWDYRGFITATHSTSVCLLLYGLGAVTPSVKENEPL